MRTFAAAAALMFAVSQAPVASADPGEFDLQSHRGGRGETTEESLRAFAKSLELGVSTLELDIVVSADNQPMVWHDPMIQADKCADTAPAFPGDPAYPYVGKLVVDLTTAQLRTLDCGKLLAAYPDAEVVHGNRIATLPEVFALADSYGAQVRYNIETKVEADAPEKSAPPQRFVEVILAAVRAANKTPYVEIQSFDWRTLPMVRAADPTIPLVALWDDTTWVPGSPWLNGVDPAVITDPIEGVLAVGADVASPNYKLVNAALIQRAHAAGLTVVPWTVNDADSMNALIDLGVDGLITDYPTLLRQVMAERGMPLPPAYQRRT